MTPAARAAAAIEVLEALETGSASAERTLSAWGRAHRFAGAKDRAAIADMVYLSLRRRRSLAWPLRAETPRAVVIGAVAAAGDDVATLFGGARHGPAPLTADERAALAAPPPPPPDPVRLDYPDWLDAALRDSLGAAFTPTMAALRDRAPLDLRANLLKTSPAAAAAALAAEGVATTPGPLSDTCLRAAPGAPAARGAAFAEGLVELQDAASQAAADFAGARPGETVLDLCAGGGGKTLALAARMAGRGRLIAHDAEPARMRDLPTRLRRAGARAEIVGPEGLARLRGACDLVLVDAPCSGSGSWRRDPLGKWRLTPARLAAATAAQAAVLGQAARYAAPGGRVVYVTCSLLAAENGGHGGFTRRRALTPLDGGDGFFMAQRG